ncbi:MAG: hypothetical protein Q9222_003524, partial [Ikaeria aurantiellina]
MPVPWPHFTGFLYRQLLVTPPLPKTRFDDKTIIVTGSNVGLGLEAARHFARLGAAHVILAVRDLEKGDAAKRSIDQSLHNNKNRSPSPVTVWKLDLSSYASVQEFAARVTKELDRVDIVCENAGIATGTFRITEKDESTITTNVVSTFLLAFLLLPKLKETARRFNTRPVLAVTTSEVVSSVPSLPFSLIPFPPPPPNSAKKKKRIIAQTNKQQHEFTTFPERHSPPHQIFTNLSDPSKANMADRYFVSKLLQLLLARAMAAHTSTITINALNPGFCHSELAREAG